MSEHGAAPVGPWRGQPRATATGGDAVWRLRSRACWAEAAELLAPLAGRDPWAALSRAELLIEQCLYTAEGWEDAENALRQAEAAARNTEQRAAAACERGFLAYVATLLHVRDRADEAKAALGRTSAILAPDAPGRPLLDFRRGLVAENLQRDPVAARTAYLRAQRGALERGDDLLRSHTSRHLAGLALRGGDVAAAREGFTVSLRLREQLGFTVGVAPALASLAEASDPAEAIRLRAEAARLAGALGGVPVWLVGRLGDPAARGVDGRGAGAADGKVS
ncbi:hypothetical protein ACIQGZ_12290 [Streptomyces sp. NPDC092296]|uniref:hypothetical protein n=1 Tax=Streptomyces sp. NPDC092296 TaxID=3366012 RepID=UPI0037FD6191